MLKADQEKTLKTLHNAQKWRRGANIPMPDPKELGKAMDEAIRLLRLLRLPDMWDSSLWLDAAPQERREAYRSIEDASHTP